MQKTLLLIILFFAGHIVAVIEVRHRAHIKAYKETHTIDLYGDRHVDWWPNINKLTRQQSHTLLSRIAHLKDNKPADMHIICFTESSGENISDKSPMQHIHHNQGLFDNKTNINVEIRQYIAAALRLFNPKTIGFEWWDENRWELNGRWTEPAKDITMGQVTNEFNKWKNYIDQYCLTNPQSHHAPIILRTLHNAVKDYRGFEAIVNKYVKRSNPTLADTNTALIFKTAPLLNERAKEHAFNKLISGGAYLFNAHLQCKIDEALRAGKQHIIGVFGSWHVDYLIDEFFDKKHIVRQHHFRLPRRLSQRTPLMGSTCPLMMPESLQPAWSDGYFAGVHNKHLFPKYRAPHIPRIRKPLVLMDELKYKWQKEVHAFKKHMKSVATTLAGKRSTMSKKHYSATGRAS